MIRDKLVQYLIPVVSRHLACTELDDEASLFEDYGLDSMEFVELMFFIEEEFGVAVNNSSELFEQLNTLGELIVYVESRSGLGDE